MRSGHAGLFGLVLACFLPATASAAEFGPAGGQGNETNADRCPGGRFLVGARVRTGAWVDQITLKCAIANVETLSLGRTNTPLPARGGGGGGESDADCPNDMWVTRIDLWFTQGHRQVRHIGLGCQSAFGAGQQFIDIGNRSGENSAGKDPITQACPPNEAAVGMNVRSGQHVNALGLICAPKPRPVKQTGSPKPTLQQTCEGYASRMVARQEEARKLSCKFLSGSGGWNEKPDYWLRQCVKWKANSTTKFNEDGLQRNLDKCKTEQAGGGIETKTVVAKVTMYDKPQGKEICYLDRHNKVRILTGDAIPAHLRNPPEKTWVAVRGSTGACIGKVGAVYDDGKLK